MMNFKFLAFNRANKHCCNFLILKPAGTFFPETTYHFKVMTLLATHVTYSGIKTTSPAF
jgi:hypothetical protein